MTERQGIEIDYCPTCRGVWLDRGELDKLIDAGSSTTGFSSQQQLPPQPPPRTAYQTERSYRPQHNIHDSDNPSHKHGKRKKGGFLGDLFDF